jgi:hypothetical protein
MHDQNLQQVLTYAQHAVGGWLSAPARPAG